MTRVPGYEFMLTPEEQHVARSTGDTRQLAKAAQTWLQLAHELGLTVSDTEARLEVVRQMDPQTAKKFRKGARTLLSTLEVAPATDGEENATNIETLPQASGVGVLPMATDDGESALTVTPEDPQPAIRLPEIVTSDDIPEQGSQQVIEPPVVEVEAGDVLINSLSIRVLDGISDNEEAAAMVRRIVAHLGISEQSSDAVYRRRVDLLDNLGIQHERGQGADDAIIEKIISWYIENAKTVMSNKVINGACFWGHLNGVDMSELIKVRRVTINSAKAQDVQNARRAVMMAYTKWLQSKTEVQPEVVLPQPINQDDAVESNAMNPVPSIELTVAEEVVPTPITLLENVGSLENEPLHVRLGNRVVKLLDMPEDLLSAAVEAFNPQARAALSANKEAVLDRLRRVVLLKDTATGLNSLDALADGGKYPRSVGPVRRLLGIFNQNNRLLLKELHTTAELVAKLPPLQQAERTNDIYEGMMGLLNVIEQRMQKGVISLQDEDETTIRRVAIDDSGAAVLR